MIALATHVKGLLTRGCAEHVFPGACVYVRIGATAFIVEVGCLSYPNGNGSPPLVSRNTLYDLASLTKVIVTTTAILQLATAGCVDLNSPIAHYLPDLSPEAKSRGVTVRHLLTHTAGYPRTGDPTNDLHRSCHTRESVIRRLLEIVPSICGVADESSCAYTDFDYLLLGLLVERIAGVTLDTYAEETIFSPLGMRSTTYHPMGRDRNQIAPTEVSELRGGLVWGEVHDEHAWRMGGVSGNAGLFSSTTDVGTFCDALLNGWSAPGLPPVAPKFLRALDKQISHDRSLAAFGLGWMVNAPFMGSLGDLSDGPSFGHTGFTGTSIVLNRRLHLAVVLLTNRVHPTRDLSREAIREYRKLLHDMIAREISSAS